MKLSSNGYNFLAKEEGLRLTSYTATEAERKKGIWTIGYGNTFYEDGTPVKEGEKITKTRALELFHLIVEKFEQAVDERIKAGLTQNQFDALVSLAYNIGIAAFNGSTVAKRVNEDPDNPAIRHYIEAWRYSGGKPILLNRRKREAKLYFTP